MRKYALVFTIGLMLFAFFCPRYEARAMDPATIAILTPIAIQAAKILLPHVVRGSINVSKMGFKIGKESLNILRLPLGLIQSLFLFPFGKCFTNGLKNMGLGLLAPFKMAFYCLLLPVSIFGVGVQ